MYCRNCGAPVNDRAVVCVKCGAALGKARQEDDGSFLWAVVGFCVPVAALVLYLMWKDEKPRCARKAVLGAVACLGMAMGIMVLCLLMNLGIAAFTILLALLTGY